MPIAKTSIFLALALLAPAAQAAKADKFAPLYAQMDAASQAYREGQVALDKGDDKAMARMSKSLEDLEDLAQQCLKQRGCDVTRVLTTYETLLKEHDLGPSEMIEGEGPSGANVPGSPVLANSSEAQRSMDLLDQGSEFDNMVEFNEPVQAAIRDWLTSQRAFLIDAWETTSTCVT